MNTRQANRWLAIIGLTVGGVYVLATNLVQVASDPDVDAVEAWLVLMPFAAGRSLICIAAAWLIFRRQYQRLCSMLSGVLAMVVLVGVGVVPQMVDLDEMGAPRWIRLLSIPVCLIALFGCYHAARWTYLSAESLLTRLITDKGLTSSGENDGGQGRDFAAGIPLDPPLHPEPRQEAEPTLSLSRAPHLSAPHDRRRA